jgi:WD40 repeat protein
LTGDAGSFLRLWSTETYGQIWSVEAGQNSITALKSVGSKIVTGSSDGSVKLWDLESGTLLKELASSDAAWQVDVVGDKIIALVSRMGEVVLEVSHHSALKSFLERVDWLMGFDVDVGTIQFRLKAGECRDVLRR